MTELQEKSINAIRILSAEAIEKANSGHPGLPMGAASIAFELYAKHLRQNPKNPKWENRDRFVLSAGHGSMLLYSMLYFYGYGLTMDDIKQFRQLGSLTPGHPEYGHTVGVETTTGPLGQGIANAVGMAFAESLLAATFNKPKFPIVDHYTYCLVGDGCMEEGISMEAASLAGAWGLGKLIVFYDSNDITIEGDIHSTFSDDVAARFEAQGWHVSPTVQDFNDLGAIDAAVAEAKKVKDKPSLIIVKTVIGYGSNKAGSADSHGAPLGKDSLAGAKKTLAWTEDPFTIPDDVKKYYEKLAAGCAKYEEKWNELFAAYEQAYPQEAAEYRRWMKNELPDLKNMEELWEVPAKADATRNAGGNVLNKLAAVIPNIVGGSADLGPSNKSEMKGQSFYSKQNRTGHNIHFGIREHAMAAVANGIYVHGGLNVYAATFFVFSDYMKNAMRMSALMKLPVTYVLTHDSIGVGEDGPTHQPVEHIVGLRSIPNMIVWRPCDSRETATAWVDAISGNGPACLVLSRQNLPQQPSDKELSFCGGYILVDSKKRVPDCILMASGSEVDLAVKAKEALRAYKIDARVVSMPCMEVFDKQSEQYKESVLPKKVRRRVAIEAASSMSWMKYVGLDGATVCMDSFGASAPAEVLFPHFGFTVENVVAKVRALKK